MITISGLKIQIIRFLIVGFSSAFIDIGLLILFKEKLNFNPVLAVAINQIFVITYNFLLNKYWSFTSKRQPLRQFGRYIILVIFNYLASIGIMYLLYNLADLNYKVIRVLSIGLLFCFNFMLYKYWVYNEK